MPRAIHVLLASLSLLLMIRCSSPSPQAEQQEVIPIINPSFEFRPNILWLVAEDLSPYIPAFGDSTIVTPNLDRLANEGVCYDYFFTPHPVCAPARASIITGMYANHIAASHMRTGGANASQESRARYTTRMPEGVQAYEAMPPTGVKMFPEYLRAAGYYCTNNAKQDYQFVRTMTCWDESSNEAHWRNRQSGQPFFAIFNFEVTHESRIWRKAEDSLWVAEDLEVEVPPYLPQNEVGQTDMRRMYSNVLEMDAQVGSVLRQLEEDGLMDSTVIFWYGDHGGPLARQKRLVYESGTRVPLIVRFPGAAMAGSRDQRITSFIDLAPTLLSLTGIPIPANVEGSAFLGKYMRQTEPQYAFAAGDRFDEMPDKIRAVRDKQFRYIRYYEPEKPMYLDVPYRRQMAVMSELLRMREAGELDEIQSLWFRETKPTEELFDVNADPHEVNNLADDPAYAQKLEELRGVLHEWVANSNDTGMMPEPALIDSLWGTNRVQPVVAVPELSKVGSQVTISCSTPGASIGYRTDPNAESWEIYTGPFGIADNQTVVAVADRIGWVRSEEVRLN